jgi:hypothetical protein
MPPWTARQSQHATDHSSTRHLATSPVQTPGNNSPSRFCSSVDLNHAPTVPVVHRQSGQSRHAVPVCCDLSCPCNAHTLARHSTRVALPPLPIPTVHHVDPAAPRFLGSTTEPDAIPRGTDTHRRTMRVPWNRLTTPSPDAAFNAQWRPSRCTLD